MLNNICNSAINWRLKLKTKFNSFLFLALGRLGLHPLTTVVLFNCPHFFALDYSILYCIIGDFRLPNSHSDLSISVNFLKISTKFCKSSIERMWYFFSILHWRFLFLLLKMILANCLIFASSGWKVILLLVTWTKTPKLNVGCTYTLCFIRNRAVVRIDWC